MALTPVDQLGDVLLQTLREPPFHGSGTPAAVLDAMGPSPRFTPTPQDRRRDPEDPRTPIWQSRVYKAVRRLIGQQFLRVDRDRWTLTPAGEGAADEALRRAAEATAADGDAVPQPVTKAADNRSLLRPSVVAAPLLDPDARARIGFPVDEATPLPVLIELNVRYSGGILEAHRRLLELLEGVGPQVRQPHQLTEDVVAARLTMTQVQALVEADAAGSRASSQRAVHRVWPDFPVQPLIDRSARTIKADAGRRSFGATGQDIVWAVIDSGIERRHPHFARWETLTHPDVLELHRDFTTTLAPGPETAEAALVDERGHGTHVAGIIAGELPPGQTDQPVQVLRDQFADAERDMPGDTTGRTFDPDLLAGVAPRTRLVSLKALPADGDGDSSRVIAALRYVRQVNASSDQLMRIHGVNISVGYEFDPTWFACGQSLLCKEVDRLVRSGVVVVVAAGNTGYGRVTATFRQTSTSLAMTINDPGNAERAITVGSTHRDRPHTYGVSYFSSKGPTGDGRPKPDLLAPGERIASCAAGAKRAAKVTGDVPPDAPIYIEQDGTSMAAPHVSGAIAAFLSVRREFICQPELVKRIFCDTATSLGREPYFQGAGLVDLMRALQHV
ncbi:S8 family peptidase [Dactylosporangium sp. NPDC049525]|uniref:S8 family peptidase n=1 Tax=Dactylosporangium sp. NPDC049525 TaxID=3154730 RepID=UPI00344212EB